MLNPEFHWLRQIATTLPKFHWWFWIIFLDTFAKAKKLICKSIAQNLKQVSLTKSFLALAMVFNLLLSNLTTIAKAKKPLCQWNWQGYFFQLATKIHELEPRPKVAKLFFSGLGVTGFKSIWNFVLLNFSSFLSIIWALIVSKIYSSPKTFL